MTYILYGIKACDTTMRLGPGSTGTRSPTTSTLQGRRHRLTNTCGAGAPEHGYQTSPPTAPAPPSRKLDEAQKADLDEPRRSS